MNKLILASLKKNAEAMFKEQYALAFIGIYERNRQEGKSTTGFLRDWLKKGEASFSEKYGGIAGKIDFPLYMRFLDIKYRGGRGTRRQRKAIGKYRRTGELRIYNAQLWGHMYAQTIKDLREALSTGWLDGTISKDIDQLVESLKV